MLIKKLDFIRISLLSIILSAIFIAFFSLGIHAEEIQIYEASAELKNIEASLEWYF